MSKYYNATPTNYAEANEILGFGTRRELKIAHNTTIRRVDSDTIAIRLHNTDVVTFHDGLPSGHGSGWIGWTVLNSGGWQTVTTKERINRYLPEGWKLSQHNWQWVVSWPDDGEYALNFVDGFTIHHFTTGSSPIALPLYRAS